MKHCAVVMMVFLLSSCSSRVVKTRTNKTKEIKGSGVIHRPVLVDLVITETRVTGTAKLAISSENPSESDIERAKQNALSKALKNSKADVLIEPVYEVESELTASGSVITARVTGFPGNYRNFRNVTEDDLIYLRPFLGYGSERSIHKHVGGRIRNNSQDNEWLMGDLACTGQCTCHPETRTCVCTGGHRCEVEDEIDLNLICRGNEKCNLRCGDLCNVECLSAAGCRAEIGDKSTAVCKGDVDCDYECKGDCVVSCPGNARCMVFCPPNANCEIKNCRVSQLKICADGVLTCRRDCS